MITVGDRIRLRLAELAREYKRKRGSLLRALARIEKQPVYRVSKDMHYDSGRKWKFYREDRNVPLCGNGKGLSGPVTKNEAMVSCMRCLKLLDKSLDTRRGLR